MSPRPPLKPAALLSSCSHTIWQRGAVIPPGRQGKTLGVRQPLSLRRLGRVPEKAPVFVVRSGAAKGMQRQSFQRPVPS